jgi:F-box/WD-40 domain protein MET30
MEPSGFPTLTRGSSNPRQNGIALRTNDDDSSLSLHGHRPYKSSSLLPTPEHNDPTTTVATGADCDRRRPEEGEHKRMANMSPLLVSQTVTPYLREHIPNLYAPISKPDNEEASKSKDSNSKFCYRHRPDSKCRKAADESKMGMIQRVCHTTHACSASIMTLTVSLLGA